MPTIPNSRDITLAEARELEDHLVAISEEKNLGPVTIEIFNTQGERVSLAMQDGAISASSRSMYEMSQAVVTSNTVDWRDWLIERRLIEHGTTYIGVDVRVGGTRIYRDGQFIGICMVCCQSYKDGSELISERPNSWNTTPISEREGPSIPEGSLYNTPL